MFFAIVVLEIIVKKLSSKFRPAILRNLFLRPQKHYLEAGISSFDFLPVLV